MAETIKEHDFVELEYTGRLADGEVFDTTVEKIAKESGLYSSKAKYSPAVVCIGERQVLPGLDEEIVGKEVGKEYTITIPPEKAFGRRDIKNIKIVPMSTFKEHKIDPYPGLQVDMDGEMGLVTRVAGGRVMVNFNHPLAGKEVTYSFKILRLIEDRREKVAIFISNALRIPQESFEVAVAEAENKATIKIPAEMPAEIAKIFSQKLTEVTGIKEFVFEKKVVEKKAKA